MMTKKKKVSHNLFIMFADISGSTAIYDKMGNELALQLITNTLNMLIHEMTIHHGTLIKTIGDEILCTYQDASDAINAACAMQMAVEEHPLVELLPVSIRIGLHYGDVILETNDIFGDAVNVAARITALTRPRQIMTTQAVIDQLPEDLKVKARPGISMGLRGKHLSIDTFHILWEMDNTMITKVSMKGFRKPEGAPDKLMLRYNKKVMTMSEDLKHIVLGRGEGCDLLVHSKLSSRQHATIEYNYGKFLLTDHSVNGTFVRFGNNQDIMLKHQQIVLHSGGKISFGQPFSDAHNEVVEYILYRSE